MARRWGLSPRVWGSRLARAGAHVRLGSIPTCAGQPSGKDISLGTGKVYPHVCGAAERSAMKELAEQGLSPRVRGSLNSPRLYREARGSIPTCAGQPCTASLAAYGAKVYPHVCGAATISTITSCQPLGLSPRVRGSPAATWVNPNDAGSIPTCAGQPGTIAPLITSSSVYPHVCGAAALSRPSHISARGLSPRVRGSRDACATPSICFRSIPTCAGQPIRLTKSRTSKTVYPHVCGAALLFPMPHAMTKGLSPRVRGSRSA